MTGYCAQCPIYHIDRNIYIYIYSHEKRFDPKHQTLTEGWVSSVMRQLKPLDKQTQTTEDIKDNVNTVRAAEYKDSMILDPLAGMAE